ncbi:DUF6461 domain-containing protein [Actinomadura sp. 6N118]|uniref:DUF6461 domain-containing protein n=1 Tax=Actinomadura sp. 6N118 TaxID=3375151 RepID=UPI0037B872DB
MAGLAWMYGRDLPLLSLTFARDLTAWQLLNRMGVDSATLAMRDQDIFLDEFGDMLYDDGAYVVSAGRYGSWAWAWEHGSWLCIEDDDLVRRVSARTTAVVLHANEKAMAEFLYAEDGQLSVGINTLLSLRPEDRLGSDPHRLDTELRALGADPDRGEYGPLGLRGLFYRLVENFGVGLPREDLNKNPVLSGRLKPRS